LIEFEVVVEGGGRRGGCKLTSEVSVSGMSSPPGNFLAVFFFLFLNFKPA
jgi:hypothetical protein